MLTIPAEGEPVDAAVTADGKIGRSRHQLLALAARELETLRAYMRAAVTEDATLAPSNLDFVMATIAKAEFVLHDCHVPAENEELEATEQTRLLTTNPSELMWPEEQTMMALRAEQKVAMAVIVKQATHNQQATKIEDFVPLELTGRLLNCCARSLSVCSMYLVLLAKQLCATMHPILDVCAEYDKIEEATFFDLPKPLYASQANATNNATLAIFNGTYQTADLRTGSMIPPLETHALDTAAKIRALGKHTALLRLCTAVAASTRQREAPVARGGDADAAAIWAIVTALACALPYTFQLDTQKSHRYPAREGTLSFLSGMTIRGGFAGGSAVSSMLLAFVGMRLQ